MYEAATLDPSDLATPHRAVAGPVGDVRARLAGAGALTFAGIVVLQNLIRGASAPPNDATTAEVVAKYGDHRSITFVLVAMFVVSGLGLVTFLGGAARRFLSGGRPGWASTGLVGAVGILGLFSVTLACEQALSVLASASHPDASAVAAVWALHNCVFTVLLLMIAVALLGLSRAGVAAGITPRVFEKLGPIGAATLVLGCLAGPSIAKGGAMPIFGLSLLGFVTWLAFLAATGIRLVRTSGSEAVAA